MVRWAQHQNLSSNCKLALKCHGPFPIKRALSTITYQLTLPEQWKIHDVFHVDLLTPYRETVTNQGIGPRRTDTETLVTRETSAGRVPLVPFRYRAGRTTGNSRGHPLVQSPGVWERIQPSMGKLYHNGMIR